MTAAEARAAVLEGRTVRMIVGTDPEDPVLLVSLDGNTIMSHGIRGWSAGCAEPVCAASSDFLERDFFANVHALELEPTTTTR